MVINGTWYVHMVYGDAFIFRVPNAAKNVRRWELVEWKFRH